MAVPSSGYGVVKTQRNSAVWWLLILGLLNGVLLVLAPAEQTLGQVVKLVYLHGALIRAELIAFLVAGAFGIAWLVLKSDWVYSWLVAIQRAAAATWLVYLASSLIVTYLAWGMAVAWSEPRTMVMLRLSLAVLAFFLVSELLRLPALRAIANMVLGMLAVVLTQSAGTIRHPIDPIGTSSSPTIQLFYLGIVLVTVAMVAVGAVWMRSRFTPRLTQSGRQ